MLTKKPWREMPATASGWWRWGESNSCPKAYPHELLRVYSVIAENSRSLAQRQTDTPVCLVDCDTSQGYSRRFVTFTTDRRLYQSRGTLRQDERWLKQQLIQNYRCRLILKRTPFKECALLYSLIVLQNPRRNQYNPGNAFRYKFARSLTVAYYFYMISQCHLSVNCTFLKNQ